MIGEAEARRDATIAEAKAEEQRMEAKLKNDTEIARFKALKILATISNLLNDSSRNITWKSLIEVTIIRNNYFYFSLSTIYFDFLSS